MQVNSTSTGVPASTVRGCCNGSAYCFQCVAGASGALVSTTPLPNSVWNHAARAFSFPAEPSVKRSAARNGNLADAAGYRSTSVVHIGCSAGEQLLRRDRILRPHHFVRRRIRNRAEIDIQRLRPQVRRVGVELAMRDRRNAGRDAAGQHPSLGLQPSIARDEQRIQQVLVDAEGAEPFGHDDVDLRGQRHRLDVSFQHLHAIRGTIVRHHAPRDARDARLLHREHAARSGACGKQAENAAPAPMSRTVSPGRTASAIAR